MNQRSDAMIYKKIMVPVDDSMASMNALDEASKVALACDAELLAVYVVDPAQLNWGEAELAKSQVVDEAIHDLGSRVMKHVTQKLSEQKVRFQTEVVDSDGQRIADAIVNEVNKKHCDLIVMGTHGFSGLMHLLMGSVAEGVLRKADVPVLLIRLPDNNKS